MVRRPNASFLVQRDEGILRSPLGESRSGSGQWPRGMGQVDFTSMHDQDAMKRWLAFRETTLQGIRDCRDCHPHHDPHHLLFQYLAIASFDPIVAWSVFRSTAAPEEYFYCHCVWNFAEDYGRMTHPLDRLKLLNSEPKATIEVNRGVLSRSVGDEVVVRISALAVPPPAPRFGIYLDGITSELSLMVGGSPHRISRHEFEGAYGDTARAAQQIVELLSVTSRGEIS